jgi:hypothetical protein
MLGLLFADQRLVGCQQRRWILPLGGGVGKVFRLGKLPVNARSPASAALTVGVEEWISLYYLPWKWIGFRFQGAGVELSSQTLTGTITGPNDSFRFSRSGSLAASISSIRR